VRKNFSPKVNLIIGPALQYYRLESDENFSRYITTAPANGLVLSTLYAKQYYLGGYFALNVNTKDHPVLTTRGVTWNTTLRVLNGLNDNSYDFTQLRSDFAFFVPLSKSVVIASRFGGGHNFGDFEFYQAQYLGALDNLRGYRKNRFAGESMAYNNTELRIGFGQFTSYLFPSAIGMILFHDIGRVWHDSDPSAKWHSGYGGGLWISPMKRTVISVMYTASKESKLPLIGFGWQF
jgi:outer membrane protein assembly factor BamA